MNYIPNQTAIVSSKNEKNEKNEVPLISIIIPIKVTLGRPDILNRLEYFQLDTSFPEGIEIIVVDGGSEKEALQRVNAVVNRHSNMRLVTTGRKIYDLFNLSMARNVGAQNAQGKFLLFLDVDLMPYPGFFNNIITEIHTSDISNNQTSFLMCPVIYLTEEGFETFNITNPEYRKSLFINALIQNNTKLIEKHSHGTSVILVNRLHYLRIGGNNEKFEGWGFEDYEVTTRLIRMDKQFPFPDDWLNGDGNFMRLNQYKGWKANYRLYGDVLGSKGIYLFHAPHKIEKANHNRSSQNLSLLKSCMHESARGEHRLDPLPDLNAGNTLLFRNNPFCYNRSFAPMLGKVHLKNENDFESIDVLKEFIKSQKINRVVFHNPYANEQMAQIYKYCRDYKIPILVAERGALPDSFFCDHTGFLNDSELYSPRYWDKPLTPEQLERVQGYVNDIRNGNSVLEKQSERIDIHALRDRLEIDKTKNVLFVPFQQPNDTVIRNFCGPIKTFSNFYLKVCNLVAELDDSWIVLYKKHPAEDALEPIPGAIAVDDYNIYDVLEISDAVLTINSGVGIYAMMFGKKLFVAGDSWYAYEGLCKPLKQNEVTPRSLQDTFDLDYEKVLRFIHYLRYEYYSFGKMAQRRVRYSDGSPITATTNIDVYELRILGSEFQFPQPGPPRIGWSSLLFDRYRNVTSVRTPTARNNHEQRTDQINAAIKAKFAYKIGTKFIAPWLPESGQIEWITNPFGLLKTAKHPVMKLAKKALISRSQTHS